MKLVKGSIWAKQTFEKGSRPTAETMCRWIDDKDIPGAIIAGKPYIDAVKFEINPTVNKPSSKAVDLLA